MLTAAVRDLHAEAPGQFQTDVRTSAPALWENNPWNPGTRYVMSRIPFDRDANLVWPHQARRMLREAGLRVLRSDYLFIFPRWLKRLRFLESFLSGFPLGAQYQVLAVKQ